MLLKALEDIVAILGSLKAFGNARLSLRLLIVNCRRYDCRAHRGQLLVH